MCFVPWQVLTGSGGPDLSRLAVRVEVRSLEGRGVADALGASTGVELFGEVQCGPPSTSSSAPSEGRKVTVPLSGSVCGSVSDVVRLRRPQGTPAIVFPLAELDIKAITGRGGVVCRVALRRKTGGTAPSSGTPIGECKFVVPARAAARVYPLEREAAGLQGSAFRVDAGWVGIGASTCVCLAERLGEHMLALAARQNWKEVQELAPLAVHCGWEKSVQDQCNALVVGRADEEARTALRLAVDVVASSPASQAGAGAAMAALVDARADPHVVAKDGDSPLTASLRSGGPTVGLLVSHASPSVVAAVGLKPSPPHIKLQVDWEVLRGARAFGMILFVAEQLHGKTAEDPAGVAGNSPKCHALRDTLFHAVSRRLVEMSGRVVAVMPPLRGRASSAEVLLLEQMVRLASQEDGADPRWFSVAEVHFKRGGPDAWLSAQRVVRQLAEVAARGGERAKEFMLQVAVPANGRVASEPRVLFPDRASECAVCFEPLFENAPAFFLDEDGNRSCVHYVCAGCAEDCKSNKECPLCRTACTDIASLPSIELDPRGWFKAASRGDGQLDHAELSHAVAACLPVSQERLLAALEKEEGPWKRPWDKNNSGIITEEEFFAPDTGLFAWILAHLQELHHNQRRSRTSAPDVRTDPVAWFDFWDDRGTGSLTFGEVLRGVFVVRQISALEDRSKLHEQRIEVEQLWRSAKLRTDSVSKEEFLRPEGLAALLSRSFQDTKVPTGSVRIAQLPEPVAPPARPDSASPTVATPSPLGSPVTSPPTAPARSSIPAIVRQLPPLSPPARPSRAPSDPAVEQLEAMGFPKQKAVAALRQAKGNADRAVDILLSG